MHQTAQQSHFELEIQTPRNQACDRPVFYEMCHQPNTLLGPNNILERERDQQNKKDNFTNMVKMAVFSGKFIISRFHCERKRNDHRVTGF